MIATDSYDGISNSLKYCISIDVVGSGKPCRLEVAFKVRNPMPVGVFWCVYRSYLQYLWD